MEAHCWGNPAGSAGSGSKPALQAGWSWRRVGSRSGLWKYRGFWKQAVEEGRRTVQTAPEWVSERRRKRALFQNPRQRSLGKTVKNPIVNVLGRAP